MRDLIGSYQRLERLYRLYIKSAFPLRSSVFAEERDRLLARVGILSQPPLIETVPIYPTSNLSLDQATAQLPLEYAGLSTIGRKLLPPPLKLHQHQWQSLYEVVVNNHDLVVTTGTGSGKTECFLLPLLAQLARESNTWTQMEEVPPNREWWLSGGQRIGQWAHSTRPAALRAIILYPLNALVEDQLRRLRIALDDDAVHKWLDQNRYGNRITFGRYTGQTPISGPNSDKSWPRLKKLLVEMDKQRRQILKVLDQDSMRDRDVLYYFPRMDGGEMWSRWDMQETPPDIMITNYSMLNIMMMRSLENPIFDQTRQWLQEPGHPERQFSLVIDELHAYRGTPGTEVAYILRLLLLRLGLTPESPKLRILATTASLEDDSKGRAFLREFFGRDQFSFIKGDQVAPQAHARLQLLPYETAFSTFARAVQPEPTSGPPSITPAVRSKMAELASLLGQPTGEGGEEYRLGDALTQIHAPDAIRDGIRVVNQEVRPTQIPQLDASMFPSASVGANGLTSDALRGLLLALGISQQRSTSRSAQPVRGHYFFHTLQNLWVCCNPDCTDGSIDAAKRHAVVGASKPTLGAIFGTHRLACPACGARVLDLIVCEVCGDVFVGGYRKSKKPPVILTADQPDLEKMPDRVSLSQDHQSYAVFWPLPYDNTPWATKPQTRKWNVDGIVRRWVEARLDRTTGELHQTKSKLASDAHEFVFGWLYEVPGEHTMTLAAMPTVCPRCDVDYRMRKVNKSPLRNHRTGFQKATQVLSSALFRELSADKDARGTSSARKLVVFSDSRQDAAKLSAGIERDQYRDMLRVALMQAFNRYWFDLEAFLRHIFTSSPAMLHQLELLNPALFAIAAQPRHPDDAAGTQRFQTANPPLVIHEALMWALTMPPTNPDARQEWLDLVTSYPGRVPLLNLRDTIRNKLLALGMCPGGSSSDALYYWPLNKKRSSRRLPWHTVFDWSTGSYAPLVNPTPLQRNHIAAMEALLTGELMYALFPHMARTLEGLGQGWASYRPHGNAAPALISTTEAVIRQLGTRRLHEYANYFRAGTSDNLRPFSLSYVSNRGVPPVDVVNQLVQSGSAIPAENGLVLAPDRLMLVPPPGLENGQRRGFRCPNCNAFYLHDVGLCPECQDPPVALTPCVATDDFDYYTDLTEKGDAVFYRIRCEELTGQTDKADKPKRQRWFQDIFITDEIEKVQGIDLLSVTTTMEAGVDIGGLNAVLMANMPPRRFNYQQRVGRAGRRDSAVSLAVTFCRGRSHDDFYFQRPESITGDPPPSPYVDMRSEPIFRRVLVKEALRQAFADCIAPASEAPLGGESVHGEFGNADEWSAHSPLVQAWLTDRNNEPKLLAILEALSVEIRFCQGPKVEMYSDMLQYLRNRLVLDIDAVAQDESYTQRPLSERLANAGLLPMFGFPTRVRLLYTDWPWSPSPWPPERGTVDRTLDIAISQFAPGSQTVKDKQVHTAVGVVDFYPAGVVQTDDGLCPPLPNPNGHLLLGTCDKCQAVVVPSSASVESPLPGGEPAPRSVCPVCCDPDQTLRTLDAREPRGFVTDLRPTDFEGQFEWTPRSTRPTLSINDPILSESDGHGMVRNAIVTAVKDHIYSFNDNAGEGGFDFQPGQSYGKPRHGLFVVANSSPAVTGPYPESPVAGYGLASRIALLSRRVTDVMLVSIGTWPDGTFADPTTVTGRAAWYSFAFWLRTAAAELLDVDSQELQPGFRSMSNDGRPTGQAFLCDQLENGAGYCRKLAMPDQFEGLISQADPIGLRTIAAKWIDSQILPGAATPHALECDTSCNRCLRDFGNLPYHGLLDWRLALDMARIARSSEVTVDLKTPWGSVTNPWAQTVSGPAAAIPALLSRLHYTGPTTFGSLHGYVHMKFPTLLLERHPLWQDNHPAWLEAAHEAKKRYPAHELRPIDPFTVLRRPGDCVPESKRV